MSPRSVREWSRRKLQMVSNNLETAITHLGEIRVEYDPGYPKIVGAIDSIAQMLVMCQDGVEKLRKSY